MFGGTKILSGMNHLNMNLSCSSFAKYFSASFSIFDFWVSISLFISVTSSWFRIFPIFSYKASSSRIELSSEISEWTECALLNVLEPLYSLTNHWQLEGIENKYIEMREGGLVYRLEGQEQEESIPRLLVLMLPGRAGGASYWWSVWLLAGYWFPCSPSYFILHTPVISIF